MFMVPLKLNLNCTDGFQTLSFSSHFQKYTLDYWLLIHPDPSLHLPLHYTDLPKAPIKDMQPKRAGVLCCARHPFGDEQLPRHVILWCLTRRQRTPARLAPGFSWRTRARGHPPLDRIKPNRVETTQRTQGRRKQRLVGVSCGLTTYEDTFQNICTCES